VEALTERRTKLESGTKNPFNPYFQIVSPYFYMYNCPAFICRMLIPAEGVGGDGGRPNGGKDPEFSSGKDSGDESDGLQGTAEDGDGVGTSAPQKQHGVGRSRQSKSAYVTTLGQGGINSSDSVDA
jgi:hypothetical protein